MTHLAFTQPVRPTPITDAELRERVRAKEAALWRDDIESASRNALRSVPSWPHLENRETFNGAIQDGRLQKFATGWEPRHGSALLVGLSGAGKTSAVAFRLRSLLAERTGAHLADPSKESAAAWREVAGLCWTSAHDLFVGGLGQFKNEWNSRAITRAIEAPILVIDDVGIEPNGYETALQALLDKRYAPKPRPTLVTSGLTVSECTARYGAAVVRRLAESTHGRLIDLHRGAR